MGRMLPGLASSLLIACNSADSDGGGGTSTGTIVPGVYGPYETFEGARPAG